MAPPSVSAKQAREERRRQVAQLYPAGASLNELGRRFNVSDTAILNDLKVMGIPRRAPGPSFTYDTAEFVRLYQSGVNCREIGRRTGADRSTVEDHLKRAGIEVVQRPNSASDEVRAEARAMYEL